MCNPRRYVLGLEKHAVPSAGLLLTAVGHCPGSRGTRTAQDQLEAANRHLAERRRVLHVQIETERLRIKGNRPLNIFDLISHAPEPDDPAVFRVGILVVLHGSPFSLSGTSTGPSPRRLDGGDVDLRHRHHRLKGALRFIATSRKSISQCARGDLPGETPAILAPAALALAA